jgi:dTDP-4-dehydrorhamnose 3,5-epimerase
MSARFDVLPAPIAGLAVLERKPVGDARGFLERLFGAEDLAGMLGDRRVEQVNRTLTKRAGTVRGLHYQLPPFGEAKLVTCLRGEVFDVAVDVRRGSPTFLAWHAVRLSGDVPRTFWIPEGFAHGFQTLTDDCEMLYVHTAPFRPASEAGLDPRDPAIDVDWPLAITETSARDAAHPRVTAGFTGVAP